VFQNQQEQEKHPARSR